MEQNLEDHGDTGRYWVREAPESLRTTEFPSHAWHGSFPRSVSLQAMTNLYMYILDILYDECRPPVCHGQAVVPTNQPIHLHMHDLHP